MLTTLFQSNKNSSEWKLENSLALVWLSNSIFNYIFKGGDRTKFEEFPPMSFRHGSDTNDHSGRFHSFPG